MKLLDTNVMMYALGKPHPYKAPCQKIMEMSERALREFTIDVEILQEILHTFWLRQEREKGIQKVKDLLLIFPDTVPVGAREISTAMGIFGQYHRLSSRDAIHAAVVMIHGLEGIVSADRAFDQVPGLRRYDPGELASGL
ncbi:MAG: type II toxin-antitoxin system VapC family toxin [Chloroflexi bacterium]|nr:type II toxin-antitoxin system VapC family toxin [Chloroflexota bacterium]